MNPIPSYYDDLDLSFAEARALTEQGASQRKSPAHCPVVATLDAQGRPSQRVMILREADWDKHRLRFHADSRSDKIAELAMHSDASVLFYDPEAKIQLRLSGQARIETESDLAEHGWNSSTLFARRCYLAKVGPGDVSAAPTSGLSPEMEGVQPSEAQVAEGRGNFAILLFDFDQVEWLYLANSGHRRARWNRDTHSGLWTGNWLVP
jgi:pyridoxamine 5'-phosphate oxidase